MFISWFTFWDLVELFYSLVIETKYNDKKSIAANYSSEIL